MTSKKASFTFVVSVIALFVLFLALLFTFDNREVYTEERTMMGTTVEISVVAPTSERASDAITQAFGSMEEHIDHFNNYGPESSVSLLNQDISGADETGEGTPWLSVPGPLYDLLAEAEKVSSLTDGAFDVTVGPVLDLWDQVEESGEFPAEEEVNTTLGHVGYEMMLLNATEGSVRFLDRNMSVDLGAIAKGQIVDEGIARLKEEGVSSAMINAGGDIRAYGGKPGGGPWTIAMRNPRDKDDHITRIGIRNASVVTSGDYERYFRLNDTRVSHIADPRTGYSADGVISTTVISQDASFADALSTASFVAGEEEAFDFISGLENTELMLIDSNRTIHRTEGFSLYEIG